MVQLACKVRMGTLRTHYVSNINAWTGTDQGAMLQGELLFNSEWLIWKSLNPWGKAHKATAISFFLECFFPLYTPKSGFLGKTSHHRKESFSPELNSRYLDYERNSNAVVRRPLTLGELILMSRRSCQRKAVQMRKQNPSMVNVHFLLLFHCHLHLKPYLDIRLLIVINN